jgi:hypothetical protein
VRNKLHEKGHGPNEAISRGWHLSKDARAT